MGDIHSEILKKYSIDIAQENIFKLYKIDDVEIAPDVLESKIQDTRKRWNTSINGANEKNAERDKARLEKADKYESILRDIKLRKKVYDFYNKKVNGSASGGDGTSAVDFSREYFKLVSTTKRIRKEDVDFFFKYYQSERKNKKAILDMLIKELKVKGLGKEANYTEENDSTEEEGKKKDHSSVETTTLFQEATILQIRKSIEKYEEAKKSDELCQRFPLLKNNLYEYLNVSDIDDAEQFSKLMSDRGKEVYALRQENGTEYVPLVDLFNILQNVGTYRDVVDNIQQFKLLLKFPKLTPYMFSFTEMKPGTIKGMVQLANRDYSFRDDSDFILNYFNLIYKNFGIRESGISSLIKKAEKKAERNIILNKIDEKLGIHKNAQKIPKVRELIHWLVYWPVFAVYFVFEVSKAIFTELHRFVIPTFVLMFLGENWLLPNYGIDNLLIIGKIFSPVEWRQCVLYAIGINAENTFELLLLSIIVILQLLAIYILPPLFVAYFLSEFSEDFNKRFDWDGLERTFNKIFTFLREKTDNHYQTYKKQFISNSLAKIFINFASLAVIIVMVSFINFKPFEDLTDSTFKPEKLYKLEENESEAVVNDESSITMVITSTSANIRSGPGTDYNVIKTVNNGDVFLATGNQQTTSNGRIWYEIYLNEEKSKTGWASQKVISFQ